jgi:hypothetical protein
MAAYSPAALRLDCPNVPVDVGQYATPRTIGGLFLRVLDPYAMQEFAIIGRIHGHLRNGKIRCISEAISPTI